MEINRTNESYPSLSLSPRSSSGITKKLFSSFLFSSRHRRNQYCVFLWIPQFPHVDHYEMKPTEEIFLASIRFLFSLNFKKINESETGVNKYLFGN